MFVLVLRPVPNTSHYSEGSLQGRLGHSICPNVRSALMEATYRFSDVWLESQPFYARRSMDIIAVAAGVV